MAAELFLCFFLCIASAEMSMSMTPQEVPPQEHSS